MACWSKIDRAFSLIGALASFLLLVLGGYVRATGAGLSCPDWPLCFDRAVPDFSIAGVSQEVGHRYLAFFVSICIIFVVVSTFKLRKAAPERWRIARWIVPVLIAQIVLGGLTVLLLLKPLIVTLHLVFGTILVQQFLALATLPSESNASPALRRLLIGGALLIGAQIALGGFVGSSGLALVCRDIPFCGETLFGVHPQEHIHMTHRVFGVLVLFYFLVVACRAQLWAGSHISGVQRFAVPALLLLQIGLGVANIWFHIPIPIALTHLALAQVILAVVINTVFRLR